MMSPLKLQLYIYKAHVYISTHSWIFTFELTLIKQSDIKAVKACTDSLRSLLELAYLKDEAE